MSARERRMAYLGAAVALVLPGGSLLVGALWLYRRLYHHLRTQYAVSLATQPGHRPL